MRVRIWNIDDMVSPVMRDEDISYLSINLGYFVERGNDEFPSHKVDMTFLRLGRLSVKVHY